MDKFDVLIPTRVTLPAETRSVSVDIDSPSQPAEAVSGFGSIEAGSPATPSNAQLPPQRHLSSRLSESEAEPGQNDVYSGSLLDLSPTLVEEIDVSPPSNPASELAVVSSLPNQPNSRPASPFSISPRDGSNILTVENTFEPVMQPESLSKSKSMLQQAHSQPSESSVRSRTLESDLPQLSSQLPGQLDAKESKVSCLIRLLLLHGQLTVSEKLQLTCSSRLIRSIATQDLFWVPVFDQLGVRQVAESPNEISPTIALEAGYEAGSAFKAFINIATALAPVYRNPDAFDEWDIVDQAKALAAARRIFELLGRPLNDITLCEDGVRAKMLNRVFHALDTRNTDELRTLIHACCAIWPETQDLVDLCLEANPHLVGLTPLAPEPKEISELTVLEALAPLSLGISRLAEDAIAFPEATAAKFMAEGYSQIASIVRAFVSETNTVLIRSPILIQGLQKFLSHTPAPLRDLLAPFVEDLTDSFLSTQLAEFESTTDVELNEWLQSVSAQEHAQEKFIWSSVPKASEKRNFLDSFRWAFGSRPTEELTEQTVDTGESEQLPEPASNGSGNSGESITAKPQTKFEAQTQVLLSKLQNIDSLVSMELCMRATDRARSAFSRARALGAPPAYLEQLFVALVERIGQRHIGSAFDKAIATLNDYDPKKYGRLVIHDVSNNSAVAVEPLGIFAELVNVGDLVLQMIHVVFEEELLAKRVVRSSDFTAPSINAKRRFEQTLDEKLADGLDRGITVLMDQFDFILKTEQLSSDYAPLPGMSPALGPTPAALHAVDLVRSLLELLSESIEKTLFDVFQVEVGMRLYHSISNHVKRQTVSLDGAVTLLSDINYYYSFAATLKQKPLMPYYEAFKQIGQLYLIDTADAKQLGKAVADFGRFKGVISTDELIEFVRCRQDWPLVRSKVEHVLYGITECIVM